MTEDQLIARLEYLSGRVEVSEGTAAYSLVVRWTQIAVDALLSEHYRAPAVVAWDEGDEDARLF